MAKNKNIYKKGKSIYSKAKRSIAEFRAEATPSIREQALMAQSEFRRHEAFKTKSAALKKLGKKKEAKLAEKKSLKSFKAFKEHEKKWKKKIKKLGLSSERYGIIV